MLAVGFHVREYPFFDSLGKSVQLVAPFLWLITTSAMMPVPFDLKVLIIVRNSVSEPKMVLWSSQ